MDYRNLIVTLTSMRQARGLSIKELAARADISERSVYHMERHEKEVSKKVLVNIAEAMGCRLNISKKYTLINTTTK